MGSSQKVRLLTPLLFLACSRGGEGAAPAASAEPTVSASSAPMASSAPRRARPPRGELPAPCGELECTRFASVSDAFAVILAEHPEVLAVGETHAQAAAPNTASATQRFTTELLPNLATTATALVLELWVADPRCDKKKVAAVAKQQADVTRTQAASDQNEFVTLGKTAEKLGVATAVLRPECAEYDRIAQAGQNDVATMLEMIARVTARDVERAWRKPPKGRKPLVIAYGGAMHNDLAPRPGRESWSFGPALAKLTSDHYIEVDLIVPEYIKDSETWRALPWYTHYDPVTLGDSVVLFKPAPRSYAVIFAETPR